jgi:hypothetical protein
MLVQDTPRHDLLLKSLGMGTLESICSRDLKQITLGKVLIIVEIDTHYF